MCCCIHQGVLEFDKDPKSFNHCRVHIVTPPFLHVIVTPNSDHLHDRIHVVKSNTLITDEFLKGHIHGQITSRRCTILVALIVEVSLTQQQCALRCNQRTLTGNFL